MTEPELQTDPPTRTCCGILFQDNICPRCATNAAGEKVGIHRPRKVCRGCGRYELQHDRCPNCGLVVH